MTIRDLNLAKKEQRCLGCNKLHKTTRVKRFCPTCTDFIKGKRFPKNRVPSLSNDNMLSCNSLPNNLRKACQEFLDLA